MGPHGSEDAGGRRGRLDAGLRAGRRGLRAAHRLRQRRQPADRAQPASRPRAGHSRRPRRDARAGCSSTSSSKPACSPPPPRWSGSVSRCWRCSWWRSTAPTTSRASTRCGSRRRRSPGWPASRRPAASSSGSCRRWHGTRLRVDQALRAGGRSSTVGPASRRVQRALVAAEFALATPLLVAGALVLASLDRLTRVPVGIDTTHLLTASVSLPRPGYREATRIGRRSGSAPSSACPRCRASRAWRSPTAGRRARAGSSNNFDLEDRPTPAGQNQPVCTWVGVSPGFFTTAGVTLQRGRLLDERSLQEDVVVVDRAWAARFFPGQEVLGRRFRNGGCTTCPWTTVVGVVGDVRWTGLDATGQDGTVYFPLVDLPSAFFLVRTAGDPLAMRAVRAPGGEGARSRPGARRRRHRRRSDGRGAGDAALSRRADRRCSRARRSCCRSSASTA